MGKYFDDDFKERYEIYTIKKALVFLSNASFFVNYLWFNSFNLQITYKKGLNKS